MNDIFTKTGNIPDISIDIVSKTPKYKSN